MKDDCAGQEGKTIDGIAFWIEVERGVFYFFELCVFGDVCVQKYFCHN